jgi:hypothetical protein
MEKRDPGYLSKKTMKTKRMWIGLCLFGLLSCNGRIQPPEKNEPVFAAMDEEMRSNPLPFDSTVRSIHVFVALCDNRYQGIVPVPAAIGNGQDPANNLYWGCGFGIKTFFKRSKEWMLVKTQQPDSVRLERLVFKHRVRNVYLIADAWDGARIQECTVDFLKSSAGQLKDTVMADGRAIGIAGNAQLIAYIGHNGLMDFQLTQGYPSADDLRRDVIILACYSKNYFSPLMEQANANPLVWTTGLMAPEAYTLHDAITGYVNNESAESIRTRAALAYARYQQCSERAVRNLLVTGW